MSNGVIAAFFTVCHLYSDSVWTAHTPDLNLERPHILGFYIVKRLGMSASNIGAKRAALRTTRVFDSSNDVHFTPPHF